MSSKCSVHGPNLIHHEPMVTLLGRKIHADGHCCQEVRLLDEVTLRILHAIREIVGPNVKGVGPDLPALLEHELMVEQDPYDVLRGIEQAERYGFVNVSRGFGGPREGYPEGPHELRSVLAVYILEAGQRYLDP